MQQQICTRFGKEFTWELKSKMMGRKALDAAQQLIDDLQLQGQITADEFVAEREQLLHSLFATCKAMPGAERLVRHLQRSGIPCCVATSSHARHFELKSSSHRDFFACFDFIVTGDMVPNGKPAPDIFETAAAKWAPSPEPVECLVFEDAPLGVDAALAAGMQCVMVPDANLDVQQTQQATHVCSSLLKFQPERFGLPAFSTDG